MSARAALFLVMFLAGWNDASAGPLLPSLQAYYNVSIIRYTRDLLTRSAIQIDYIVSTYLCHSKVGQRLMI